MVSRLLSMGHHTPLEFVTLKFRVRCNRAVSHELVRHRHMSVVQESQRYVKVPDGGFAFDLPPDCPVNLKRSFDAFYRRAEALYRDLLEKGVKAEDARLVLPNAVMSTLHVMMNLREFRHFVDLRTSAAAWEPMRRVAGEMVFRFCEACPQDRFLLAGVVH